MWHAEREEWVSLAAHPAARQALESIGSYLPMSEAIEMVEPESAPGADVPVPDLEPAAEVPAPENPALEAPEPDPLDALLAAAHEFILPAPADPLPIPQQPEPTEAEPKQPDPEILLNITPAPVALPPAPPAARPSHLDITPPPRTHERRALEMSPAVERRRSAAATPPPEPAPAPQRSFKLPSRRILIGGGIAALIIAAGYFVKSRAGGANPRDVPPTVAAAADHPTVAPPAVPPAVPPSAQESIPAPVVPTSSADSVTAPQVGALELQGVPGEGPEADLETRLGLADALMWNPAQDFGSAADVLRARRKVDAVLNSVQAYRVDMRRLAASGGASNPGDRIEPFDEASRIDDVIHAMGDAISVLEDVAGRFAVRGGTLEFDRTDDARRYNQLRDRADSLLRAPVEMDTHPVVRPPRRLVTRLLTTLPGGMARGASGT